MILVFLGVGNFISTHTSVRAKDLNASLNFKLHVSVL